MNDNDDVHLTAGVETSDLKMAFLLGSSGHYISLLQLNTHLIDEDLLNTHPYL